jgi:hypothetical protein
MGQQLTAAMTPWLLLYQLEAVLTAAARDAPAHILEMVLACLNGADTSIYTGGEQEKLCKTYPVMATKTATVHTQLHCHPSIDSLMSLP